MSTLLERQPAVLVVDDDKPILRVLEEILVDAGFKPACFDRGALALAAIEQRHFDMLIIDMHLPDIHGLRLTERARERYGSTSAILVITANSRHQWVSAALELGADDFLTKPFNIEELLARINSKLRRLGLERS